MTEDFSKLGRKDREKLPLSDFAYPEKRLYPIMDASDVTAAAHLVGRSNTGNPETIKANIIKIAKRKGFADAIPKTWQDEKAKMAEYTLDQAAFTNDGEYVLRTGKIFEAGEYKDKRFDLSPEEMLVAVNDFKPVDIDIEHVSSVFDGKLGKLETVVIADNGYDLIGTARIPKWLDSVLGEGAKKVSATWDRASKTLTKLALVRNPRVADAALMAAFTANETAKNTEFEPLLKEILEQWFSKDENLSDFAHRTWEGKSTLQGIHDMAARAGAVCTDPADKAAEANQAKAPVTALYNESEFVSKGESKLIQQIHDASGRGGAKCSSSGMSMYNKETGKVMVTLKDIKEFFAGVSEDANLSELETAQKAKEAKEAEAVKLSTEKSDREKALEDEVARLKEAEACHAEKEAEYKEKEIVSDAEKFIDAEIKKGTAFPAERNGAVALYTQAAKDDSITQTKISFKQGDKEVEGSRVDAFKSLFSVRKPHGLTTEQLAADGVNVLEVVELSDSKKYKEEAEQQARDYAAKENKGKK